MSECGTEFLLELILQHTIEGIVQEVPLGVAVDDHRIVIWNWGLNICVHHRYWQQYQNGIFFCQADTKIIFDPTKNAYTPSIRNYMMYRTYAMVR